MLTGYLALSSSVATSLFIDLQSPSSAEYFTKKACFHIQSRPIFEIRQLDLGFHSLKLVFILSILNMSSCNIPIPELKIVIKEFVTECVWEIIIV